MNVPEIRFKEFDEEWSENLLKDFFTKVTSKNRKLKYSAVLTNSAEYGIIGQLDYFDFDVTNSNNIGGYFIVEPDDFVYMDAGTTTGCMIDYITEKRAVYVTNAVTHARNLAALGFRVILIGGELKGSTEAVVGANAIEMLRNYNFNKGFFGTNGISIKCGFTTPDINEAEVKKMAMCHCNHKIILADSTKFDNVSSVTFARIDTAKIITDEEVPAGYRDYNIYKVNG